jgi:cytochrome P450
MTDAEPRPSDRSPIVYDPYDAAIVHNPFPVYARLRDEAPVYRNEQLGFYALSRYADVVEAHLDYETFSSAKGVTIEGDEAATPLLIVKDPPEHTLHRRIVAPLFTPRRISALEPFIRQTAADLLDPLAGRDAFEFVHEFAIQLPMHVISELLDIPVDLRDEIVQLAELVASGLGRDASPEEAVAAKGLTVLLVELASQRRRQPGSDLVSLLMTTPVDDGAGGTRLPGDAELGTRFLELAFAGHETVAKLISNAIVALKWHPDERARVVADPALLPKAVEEALRWDPPSHYQGRTTTREVTLHGVTIPADRRVLLMTGAALHDPREFPDPERYDLDRPLERHVGFGLGRHMCLGSSLARMETRIALEEFLKRYADWELVEGGAVRALQGNLRGLTQLQLSVTPRAGRPQTLPR